MSVETLKASDPCAIVCGAEYTIAICRGGKEVYSWGWYETLASSILNFPAVSSPPHLAKSCRCSRCPQSCACHHFTLPPFHPSTIHVDSVLVDKGLGCWQIA
jgi:hypothetical protein